MRAHNILNDVDYDVTYDDTAIKNIATYVIDAIVILI